MKKTLLSIIIIILSACSSTKKPKVFATPEQAVQALGTAISLEKTNDFDSLFGEDGRYLLDSGDPTQDKLRTAEFRRLYERKRKLEPLNGKSYALLVGEFNWPFPVPIVKSDAGWYFNAEDAQEEILARRIGRNELTALSTAHKIYLAQKIYRARDWEGDGIRNYATRIISSPGKKDGLYWPEEPSGTGQSPLGPVIAGAATESYKIDQTGEPQPYFGYYYKLLNKGDQDGYQLLVYPARHGESGIMSFILTEKGWIFEKDLGAEFALKPDTALDLDITWRRIA